MSASESPAQTPDRRRWYRLDLALENLLNRGDADKCLFVLLSSMVSAALWWALGESVLRNPAHTPFYDLRVLGYFQRGLELYVAVSVILSIAGFALRKRDPNNRPLVWATVVVYSVVSALGSYSIGLATGPYAMVLLSAAVLGLFLFERRVVIAGCGIALGILAATTLAESLGTLRYAPLFAQPPYQHGAIDPAWKREMLTIQALTSGIVLAVFSALVARLRDRESRLAHLARTDGLTGVANRRHFMEALDLELARARRAQWPVTVILLDLDHFKSINDRFGHQVGDRALQSAARALESTTRSIDLIARYGGEEFAILLPQSNREGGALAAERCRDALERAPVSVEGEEIPRTASFGVATWEAGGGSAQELLQRADEALYRAKSAGRNCVRAAA